MPRLRKTRMVSFRISSEEYDALKSLHRSFGHRSISDFARSAVQRLILTLSASETPVERVLHDLSDRMNLLDRQVADLHRLMESQQKHGAVLR